MLVGIDVRVEAQEITKCTEVRPRCHQDVSHDASLDPAGRGCQPRCQVECRHACSTGLSPTEPRRTAGSKRRWVTTQSFRDAGAPGVAHCLESRSRDAVTHAAQAACRTRRSVVLTARFVGTGWRSPIHPSTAQAAQMAAWLERLPPWCTFRSNSTYGTVSPL